ncbi:MAG: radical SAM protein [Firmicutes bacterium]|nr:radical SAM protein [Bacillota bacterium]
MFFRNPNSQRENPFRAVYDSEAFRNVLHYKDNLPSFPFLIDIELTNICNLRCIFCGQQAMTRPKGYMEWGLFKKIVDECSSLYETPIRMIRWGEPFLHPGIIDFCRYVKEKGLLLHITTNGLALNKRRENKKPCRVRVGFDNFFFSRGNQRTV